MKRLISISALLLAACQVAGSAPPQASGETAELPWPERLPLENLREVRNLSDEELRSRIDEFDPYEGPRKYEVSLDLCLHEILRRGGSGWRVYLEELLARRRALDLSRRGWPAHDLEVLTALRRMQGRPDPLTVCVEARAPIDPGFPVWPALQVRLKNQDELSFGFTFGGDDRSGRLGRWRMEVRGADGERLPSPDSGMIIVGGGVVGRGQLESGGYWGRGTELHGLHPSAPPIGLPLSDYVVGLTAGEYVVVVQYHDTVCIAGNATVDHLIVHSSPPIPFTVLPIPEEESR